MSAIEAPQPQLTQEAISQTEAPSRLRQIAARAGLALAMFTAGAGTLAEDTQPAAANTETGGYPDASLRCIYPPYNTTGACKNYDWGMKTVNEQGYSYNASVYSPRGYGYRNCTDWVAYRAKDRLGITLAALGNAKQWDDNGSSKNYTVDDTPESGDAAVWNSGDYGHVAFVEKVNNDGSVNVSEYNKAGTGIYSTRNNVRADKYVDFNGTGKGIDGATLNTPTPPAPYNGVTAISSQYENGTQHVYWATADGTLRETWFRPGQAATNVVRKFGSAITALSSQYTPGDMAQHVYVGTKEGGIHEVWWSPASGGYHSWQAFDTDSPILDMSSHLHDGLQKIHWGTENGRVGETAFRPGWVYSWEASRSNSPVRAVASEFTHGNLVHIYWGNDEGRLHETWAVPGTVGTNLMADFPYPILSLDSETDPSGAQHVYSGDLDGVVRETWFVPAAVPYNTWEAARLGAPAKVLSGEYTPNGDQHIYTGAGNKVRETWFHPGTVGTWEAAASQVEVTAMSDQYTGTDGVQHIYWGDANGKVHETWFRPGTVNTWQLPS